MASYSIGDLERLLRVKNHVIRYWEKEIPMIQPERNNFGRRMYRDRDLQLLLRLKYLLYERRFTIEGAREQLYLELTGENQDLHSRVSALRSELLALFSLVHDSGADEPAASEPPANESNCYEDEIIEKPGFEEKEV